MNIELSLNIGNSITFDYVNWKNEFGRRNATILRLVFGSSSWHPEKQWLIEAFDKDKNQIRYFALKDMSNITKEEN